MAVRRDIMGRSLRVALVVGTLIAVINHADRAFMGQLGVVDWVKIGLTYLVPYGVSTYAAVDALRKSQLVASSDHPSERG